ncbi:MAG: hypothetical protein ACREJG_01335 [Candidatus Rokuibacteriota bacterium]
MLHRIGIGALALSLFFAPGAVAQLAGEVSGTVEHVEPGSGIVKFTDGRIVHLSPTMRVWVDGREVALTDVRPGSAVIVRSQAAGTTTVQAPASTATHPPIDAYGAVSRVDKQAKTITFEDGRSLRLTERTTVWQPVQIDAVRPGTQLFVENAMPAGFRSAAGAAPQSRVVMGTVREVDPQNAVIVLDDGAKVRVSSDTKVHMGSQQMAFRDLQPGDQLVIRVKETETTRSGDASGSALPRDSGFYAAEFDAADILIIRRHQAP